MMTLKESIVYVDFGGCGWVSNAVLRRREPPCHKYSASRQRNKKKKKTPPLPCYWYPKVSKCTAVGSMKGPSQVYKVWGSVKVKGDNASGDLEATEQVEGAEGVVG